MRKLIFMGVLLGVVIACNSEKKESGNDSAKKDTVASQPADTSMNKAWATYMAPGTVHQMLAKADGTWDAEISFYQNPDSPSVDTVICENKMILGGRYQQSTYRGSLGGMAFEGMSTLAYDNSRKMYLNTWIDNMGTGLMYLEGTFDDATKTLNLKGKAVDVETGKDILVRETTKIIDQDHQLMEMYDTKDGKEKKTMSIKLTRSK
ncbi:MAG: DUF1579 domain-containing protein [Pedobacter sp.]|nr:DUF1579 domain-containing protein [Pedobacter sp.]MDQ8052673.1 DUF1579 domain-containing protein [Pedobacter sp.]